MLRHLHAAIGGTFLTAADFLDAMDARHPLAMEETFFQLVRQALAGHDVVLIDDSNLLVNVVCCGSSYPRMNFLVAALTSLGTYARERGKRLVLGTDPSALAASWARGAMVWLEELDATDYEAICHRWLGAARAGGLDYARIYRFARRLTARQLRSACDALPHDAQVDTEGFIEHLRAHHMASNVDLGEVQAVDLRDLKGMDDVLEALEANIILPLENAEIATKFGLRPKKGVLLAGPPGTGKTTVGRALAHRLRSKFFLIDGTVISGTSAFYGRIQQIFEAAKQNAPAIIFIDDSDVIFENGSELGLYRYLLTMLDGLESESAGTVCLMMTAMNVGNLPPALVRSGRIELWLETRLPDADAREAILTAHCADLPPAVGAVDIPSLVAATEGLSGADLKRLVEDGKVLFAFDHARGREARPVLEYFLTAIETVRTNKQRYAEAEAHARAHRPSRPPFFDVMEGFMTMGVPGGTSFMRGEITAEEISS